MVGRDVSFSVEKAPVKPKETVRQLKVWCKDSRGVGVVNGLDLRFERVRLWGSPVWTETVRRNFWRQSPDCGR